jgi:hypothetical protein
VNLVGRAGGIFLATWALFYLLAWNDESPIYTESGPTLLALAVAWLAFGFLLLALRQRAWGIAWLLGSASFFGGSVALILFVAFTYGS